MKSQAYKKIGENKNSGGNFTIADEEEEEEIDLQAVELGDSSRHGLTTSRTSEEQQVQSGQKLFDLCSGLSVFAVWNTLTFGWIDPLLRKGSQKALELPDLPSLLPQDQADAVYRRFRAAWAKQLDEVETPSLVAALAQGFGAPFFFAGCIKLMHDSSLFLGPLLLNRLIKFLADPSQPISHGFILVACLFAVNLAQSLCLRQYFWICFRTGMNLRAAVVTAVYAKTMVISGDALSRRTSGEISNLMSVDAGRLQDLTPYLHAVWYSVFQIVLAMYFLWQEMGVSCLAGITVIVCMIPISNRVSLYMKTLQKTISKTRDERVKITNEVLGGMKVLKLQAWERQFQQRILAVRDKELQILQNYARAQCYATGLYTAIPLLVALTTFTSFIWLGNTLDIATALTSLALFELLRFPLFMLPQVVNNVVEALVSAERITSYLSEDEQQSVPSLSPDQQTEFGGFGVSVTDASFIYDASLTRNLLPKHLQNLGENTTNNNSNTMQGKFVEYDEVANADHDDYGYYNGEDYEDNSSEGVQLTARNNLNNRNKKHFRVASYVRRPPRHPDVSVKGRFASNLPRFYHWLWSKLVYIVKLIACDTNNINNNVNNLTRTPSFSVNTSSTSTNNNATTNKAVEEKLKRPLNATEKALLLHIALLKDAEERLQLLEHQLMLNNSSNSSDVLPTDAADLLTLHQSEQENEHKKFSSTDTAVGEVRITIHNSKGDNTSSEDSRNNNNQQQEGRRLLPLRHVNLHFTAGQLVAVVGSVGSGKTSLLQALLGQLTLIPHSSYNISRGNTSPNVVNNAISNVSSGVRLSGRLAYCAQVPFIRNATLRENILFGRPFQQDCYDEVLSMTALLPDLAVLPAGDSTEIGERGINLSGGQKARVSLARAVYGVLLDDGKNADGRTQVLLLDDVLAAVDAHVGRHLFENCLLPLARDRHTLVLWVTNALQFTRHCDTIVVLQQGCVAAQGHYDTLLGQDDRGEQGGVRGSAVFRDMIAAMNSSGAAASVSNLNNTTNSSGKDADKKSVVTTTDSTAHSTTTTTSVTKDKDLATKDKSSDKSADKPLTSTSAGTLITAEGGVQGDVSRATYLTWASAAGGVSVLFLVLLFFVAGELLAISSSYWLSLWSQHNASQTKSGSSSGSGAGFYLGIYGLINFSVVLAAIWREYYLRLRGLEAARSMFEGVLSHVLYAPMQFFDTTPLGRVTNRLSKDVYTVDEQLPGSVRGFLVTTMRVTITLLYVCSITPFFLLLLVPLAVFYYLAQRYYISTSRALTRLESSSRSPIYALFSETLDGLVTIRAYKEEESGVLRSNALLNDNMTAYFCNFSANCWLAVRLESVGSLIVMGAALFAVIARDSYVSTVDISDNDSSRDDSRAKLALFAGLAGLSMSLSMSITQSLNWTVRMASDLESQMVAVERLQEYNTMVQEKAHYRINDPNNNGVVNEANNNGNSVNPLHPSISTNTNVWPSAGKLSFFNVSLRYRPNLPLVLQNVSFTIEPGHKVGVAGRTGAGKSSLLVALLRLVDPLDSGHVYLDDLDIGQLGLHCLRSSIAVIPQDPVLFSGTVRDNLDPFRRFSDVELHTALQRCHLSFNNNNNNNNSTNSNTTNNGNKKQQSLSLEDTIAENGSNLSVGQRQLLCIARALVCRSRVILMDEATAAVDVETDLLIQQTIREECVGSTVLTIAHRLNTILDSDKVLVLEQGQVAEYDAPQVLLQKGKEHSLFAQLVAHWEETEQH